MDSVKKARKHGFHSQKVITNPYEGLVFGNGDMAANAVILSHELSLELGKNDLWDSRMVDKTEDAVLRHDDLIRYEKEYGFEWPEDCTVLPQTFADWPGKPRDLEIHYASPSEDKVLENDGKEEIVVDFGGVTPKKAGRVSVLHPGMSDTHIEASLDIADGCLTLTHRFAHGACHTKAFIAKHENVLWLQIAVEGKVPWIRVHVEKAPDYADPAMPLPQVKPLDSASGYLTQTIPAGHDVTDYSWAIATRLATRRQAEGCGALVPMAYALRQDLHLKDGDKVSMAVSLKTGHEQKGGPETIGKAAMNLLPTEVSNLFFERRLEQSASLWHTFWQQSGVAFSDEKLEGIWYRSLYGFACHLKPGAQAPSLCANIPTTDHAAFHGRYTWNHNVQKWYVPALPSNHPEWFDVLADLIEQTMPTFQYLAREIFGIEGVYCDLATLPFVPPQRTPVYNKWGRALCMTGWLAHLLWQHYEYIGDLSWLEKRAYPYMSQAADFYTRYLEKYQDESGDIYPSMRLEEPGWCRDFVGNRNLVTDLCMFKNGLQDAVSAAKVLKRDPERRQAWQDALGKIPKLEHGFWADEQGWYALCKDWQNVDSVINGRRLSEFADRDWRLQEMRTARWGGGGWLVYPGEYLQGDEDCKLSQAICDMLRRIDITNPPNTICKFHAISSLIPHIRLGLKENFDDIRQLMLQHQYDSGQFSSYAAREGELIRGAGNSTWRIVENQYMGILGISEMLLQSQGCVIRLFPFWKESLDAAFKTLRAKGGFLVSATWQKGQGLVQATVESCLGNDCRIRWPYPQEPVISCGKDPVDFEKLANDTKAGYDIRFVTQAKLTYTIRLA